MGEEPPKPSHPSFREIGPAWVAAVAALITALTGAGFFVGRATASSNDVPQTNQQASSASQSTNRG